MNIMFVAIFPIVPYYGGIQRVTDILCQEMQKRGHNVIFVAYDRKERMSYESFSAPQYYVETKNRSETEIRQELLKIVEQNKTEYVICQGLGNSKFISLLPKKLKIVTVCHTQPYPRESLTRSRILWTTPKTFKDFFVKYFFYCFPSVAINYSASVENKLQQIAFDISDKVCYISERFFYRVKKHLPNIEEEKLVAINNPAIKPTIKFKEEEKENIVIWVGRIRNSSKNTIDFIKAWRDVFQHHPDWKAIIIGAGPSMKDNEKYIRKHNISNITFVGKRDDIFKFYKKAKISVVTSWSESWSMVVIESMAYGCLPIVYDTYESIHDIIKNRGNGIICEPNPKALATEINKYIEDKESRENMTLEAYKSLDRFSVEKTVDLWEALFKKM